MTIPSTPNSASSSGVSMGISTSTNDTHPPNTPLSVPHTPGTPFSTLSATPSTTLNSAAETPETGIVVDEPAKEEEEEAQPQVQAAGVVSQAALGAQKLPDDFYYDNEEFESKARTSEDDGLGPNLIKFYHSFGYDCTRRGNLHMLDEEWAMFSAGNMVELLNLDTKEQKHLRSSSGGGIGAINIHPSRKLFAVGEKGLHPNIMVYEYPSLKLYRILRGGTERAYAFLDFSPDGLLLASVGGDPDYMMTIWDWKNEEICLRCKAFSQDIFRVSFSAEIQGQLTTAGLGHIRFWKMANTFTGLKLQGEIGKFGRTEISDIEGYVELPDGKVLSGSEWGNMLLWEGTLIKVQISRKNGKPCHVGPIMQFVMDEGELYTIGKDGFVRVWDFETIDTADSTDERGMFELEPMNELRVGVGVQLVSLVKSLKQASNQSSVWVAQDANGGIWKLDLSFSHTTKPPEKIFSFHAGTITGAGASPVTHLLATTGLDKSVRIYNYLEKKSLCESRFNAPGTSLLWLPKEVDKKGKTFMVGFADGVLRVFTITMRKVEYVKKEQSADDEAIALAGKGNESTWKGLSKTVATPGDKTFTNVPEIALQQALKPHNRAVTQICLDKTGTILATGGEDKNVFFLRLTGTELEPIGFVDCPAPITNLAWTPKHFNKNSLLASCTNGEIWEIHPPANADNVDTTKTFQLNTLKFNTYKFHSIKSRLRHEEEMVKKAMADAERKRQREEERRLRKERGEEVESDDDDDDDEDDDDDWVAFVPEDPSPILHAFYDPNAANGEKSFWVSMGGYDAGYFYECEILTEEEKARAEEEEQNTTEPIRALPLLQSNDMAINSAQFCHDGKILLLGMDDGSIRAQPLVPQVEIKEEESSLPKRGRMRGKTFAARSPPSMVDPQRDAEEKPKTAGEVVRPAAPADEETGLAGAGASADAGAAGAVEPQKSGAVETVAQQRPTTSGDSVKKSNAPRKEFNWETTADMGNLLSFWAKNFHDNDYGHIRHLQLSFDDEFLFSVGDDGNIFVYQIHAKMTQSLTEEQKVRLPTPKKQSEMPSVEDIQDEKHYSIEDAKQKAEHDRMMKIAEEKKSAVRMQIAKLRTEFKKIKTRNEDLPPHIRLDMKEFEMDPEIRQEFERQKQEQIDLVHKEMAWESEKQTIALEKLEKRFKHQIECERIVLHCFLSDHQVSSFRATILSVEFHSLKQELMSHTEDDQFLLMQDDAEVEDLEDEAAAASPQPSSETDTVGAAAAAIAAAAAAATKPKKQEKPMGLTGRVGDKVAKALGKVEEKKKKRLERREAWNQLYTSKPDENFEDPSDVAAIKFAQENMGDYKLKTAEDYVVPEQLRMNTNKALRRILAQEEFIHEQREIFNQRFLELREHKRSVIEEIKGLIEKLNKIQSRLKRGLRKEPPPVPELLQEEEPERKYEYTREILDNFKMQLERKKEEQEKGQSEGPTGWATGFANAEAISREDISEKGPKEWLSPKAYDAGADEASSPSFPLTPEQQQIEEYMEISLTYQRDEVLNEIEITKKLFDADLKMLRHDKFNLEVDLKNAELRLITLYEELLLLKEFEKRENSLTEGVAVKIAEKQDSQKKVQDIEQKLDAQKKNIDRLQEKERSLHMTFVSSLGENNKFAEYLTKVFKKRIKRQKKKKEEKADSDASSESSSDESDWSESDEESDSDAGGYDLDVCPPGCDEMLYENTCSLREKRLDLEEALTEEKKVLEVLRKESEALHKKNKVIVAALKTAQAELEVFQLEKQQKLNELDIVVTLNLHQIQHVVNGVLPQDLSQCLVFDSAGVVKLQDRIRELHQEKATQRRAYKEARQSHVQLIKDQKLYEQKIGELEQKCRDMMMMKFGRMVDLEAVESVTVNRNLEELKEKMRINDARHARRMQAYDDSIAEHEERITELIRENTRKTEQLNFLMNDQRALEEELEGKTKTVGESYAKTHQVDLQEKRKLVQLVQLQQQEIEALKQEINVLSQKGGHILPPSQNHPRRPDTPDN